MNKLLLTTSLNSNLIITNLKSREKNLKRNLQKCLHLNCQCANSLKFIRLSNSQCFFVRLFGLVLFLFLMCAKSLGTIEMTREGCGDTKSCLFKPTGCNPQLDCTIGIIFFVSDINKLTVQLMAQSLLPAPHYQYIAVGFSKDGLMGEDFVSECVLSPSNSAFNDVEVFASYNHKKSNDRIYLNSDELSTLYENIEGEIIDGRLTCQFVQQIVPQINNKNNTIWNLNKKYFIIGATGSAQPDEINVHDTSIGSHFYPITTTRSINPSLVGSKVYKLPLPFVETYQMKSTAVNKPDSLKTATSYQNDVNNLKETNFIANSAKRICFVTELIIGFIFYIVFLNFNQLY